MIVITKTTVVKLNQIRPEWVNSNYTISIRPDSEQEIIGESRLIN